MCVCVGGGGGGGRLQFVPSLCLFSAEVFLERYWQGPRSQELCVSGRGKGGGREGAYILNATLSPPEWLLLSRCVAVRTILMFHWLWAAESQGSVYKPQVSKKRMESRNGGTRTDVVCLPPQRLTAGPNRLLHLGFHVDLKRLSEEALWSCFGLNRFELICGWLGSKHQLTNCPTNSLTNPVRLAGR